MKAEGEGGCFNERDMSIKLRRAWNSCTPVQAPPARGSFLSPLAGAFMSLFLATFLLSFFSVITPRYCTVRNIKRHKATLKRNAPSAVVATSKSRKSITKLLLLNIQTAEFLKTTMNLGQTASHFGWTHFTFFSFSFSLFFANFA